MKGNIQKISSKKIPLTLLAGLVLIAMFFFIFAAVPKTAKPIDNLVETLELNNGALNYETADAWTAPDHSIDFTNTHIKSGHNPYGPIQISKPEELTTASLGTSFNKARNVSNLSSNAEDSISAWEAEGKSNSTMHHLWWRDITLTDTMKEGLKNGLIDTISFAMQVEWSLNWEGLDSGAIEGSYFIALGNSTSQSPNLNNFTTLYSASTKVSARIRSSYNSTLSQNRSVSINSSNGTAWPNFANATYPVIRVGIAYRIVADALTNRTVDFQNPRCTNLSMSWTKPSFGVQKSGENYHGTITLRPYSVYNDFISDFSSTAVTNTAAENQKEGYYFSGWTSSNGPTGKNIRNFSGDNRTISVRGACDIPRGGVTYTANFRSYTLDEQTAAEYTYKQDGVSKGDGSGYSVRQGPGVASVQLLSDVTTLDPRVVIKHVDKRTMVETNVKPFNASEYYAKITVEAYGSGNPLSAGDHIYNYDIHQFNLTPLAGLGIDLTFANNEFTYNGKDKSFVNPSIPSAGRISSSEFTFMYNSVQYRLQSSLSDFTLDTTEGSTQYAGEWINSTNSQAMQTDKTKKPHIILQGNKNFTGYGNAYAKINPLKISEVQIATDMDAEIDLRYDTTFTGWEVEPDVILVRLTKGGETYTVIAHDPQNPVEARRNLYTTNYESHGEVGSYPAYQKYSGVQLSRWCNGFFRLQTDSYAFNVEPNSSASATFTIQFVLATPATDSMNFVDGSGTLDNATMTVKFNIPKRDVYDTHENTTNNTDIISDYTQIDAENKPYPMPQVYDGSKKTPVVSYVIIKATKVRLYEQAYLTGDYYWNTNGTAFYSLTNAANQPGSPTPPTTFLYNEKIYTVINAGQFASSISHGSETKDNINVACGGIVKITPLDSAKVMNSFELWFPIQPKNLEGSPLTSPGGGVIEDIPTQTYNFSEAINPTVSVEATFDKSAYAQDEVIGLIENVDYTKTITNNEEITTEALVTVTGKGNYTGQITKTFIIAALDVTNMSNVSLSNLVNREYKGSKFSDTANVGLPGYESITLNVTGRNPYTIEKMDYEVSGAGNNINVADTCWFDITFSGYAAGDPLAGTGAKFTGTKRVNFAIIPKSLASDTIDSRASWTLYAPDSVTYDGKAKKELSIVTTGETKTVVITDTARSVQLAYASNGTADYKLIFEGAEAAASWGNNPNAGLSSGSVTFTGTNNYTGDLTVYFEILPRNLSNALEVTLFTGEGSGYNQEESGFDFTGSKIEPGVYKVEIDSGKANETVLDLGTDYTISYGTDDTQVNRFVKKGGVVNIVGKGNYTGTYVKNFNIIAIEQTITFLSPLNTDPDVKLESITKTSGHSLYADFEVNADILSGREILVEARTTAIYPGPRLITFTTLVSGPQLSVSKPTYTSCEIKEINGINYSVTKAKIVVTSENRYGRLRITANQYDNETTSPAVIIGSNEFVNEGNYVKSEYNSTNPKNNTAYWLFMKKSDSVSDNAITKTYGNDAITYYRNTLRSRYSANPRIYEQYGSISLTSQDESLVTVADATNNWTVAFKKAGSTYLTLQHDGYVLDESNAYLAFEFDIPVTINPRDLTVSFAPVTVTYGEDASSKFVFTYTTRDNNDPYTGLSYQGMEDLPSEIMTGLSVQYDKNNAHKNSTSVFDGLTETHTPYNLEVLSGITQEKAGNYTISTATSTLTVLRKKLTASVSNGGEANVMRKEYGTANPSPTETVYSGFVPGEDLLSLQLQYDGSLFTYPQLQYISLGNPIDELTSIGTYMIKLSAGVMPNYTIPETLVSLIISPVAPIITLEGINTTYKAQFIGYPYQYVEEEGGETLTREAIVKPIRSDATTPSSEGFVSYQYKYSDMPWTIDKPRRAGTYGTRVIYTAAEGDNYKSTVVEFLNNIVINKANPRISLNLPTGVTQIKRAYTAEAIWGTSITPTILGIAGTTDRPMPNDIQVKFCESGENTWVNSVISAGTYDLQITFIAKVEDNYNSIIEQVFEQVFVIEDGLVSIVLQEGCTLRKTFDGTAHSFDIDKVKFLSMENDRDEFGRRKEIAGEATVMYSKDGENFTETLPVDAGTYAIYIKYETLPGGDYKTNADSFTTFRGNPLFVIEHANIQSYLGLNLPQTRQITYDAGYHYLENDLIQVGKIDTDAEGPKGTVEMRYQLSGSPSSPELIRVKDAGTYDVLIKYTEGVMGDNYKTGTKRIQSKIKIDPVNVNITFPSLYTAYDFSGDYREVSVAITGLKSELPIGTYKIEYSLHGMELFSTNRPVDAGEYDVKVTYTRRNDVADNYKDTEVRQSNILEIRKVKPTIIINNITVPLGSLDAGYNPTTGSTENPNLPILVVFKGETRDPIGPPLLNLDGSSTLTFEYGVQTPNGYVFTKWEGGSYPTASGRYAVKVSYIPKWDTESKNYMPNTQTAYMCLTIENIAPEFALDSKVAIYTGSNISANIATITNATTLVPKGIIAYEYRKQNTNEWRSTPSEVGIYDVRVKYLPSTSGDSYASSVKDFIAALEIMPMQITIVPILGQGGQYGGDFDNPNLIYAYVYEMNGKKYFAYPTITESRFGDRIDVSEGIYVDRGDYGYMLDVVDGKAWRDYLKFDLDINNASFSTDGAEDINITDLSQLVTIEGVAEYINGNREFLIDLENLVVSHKNTYDSVVYTYGHKTGLFFSTLDANSNVDVIEVVNSRAEWINTEKTQGIYRVAKDGISYVYSINRINMTATLGNKVHKLTDTVGVIEYRVGNNLKTILVDEREFFAKNLQENSALYRSSDGYIYEVDLTENTATRKYALKVKSISFTYTTDRVVNNRLEEKTDRVNISALDRLYTNQSGYYIYRTVDDATGIEQVFVIDIKNKLALKDLTYTYNQDAEENYFVYLTSSGNTQRVVVNTGDLVETMREGEYIYTASDNNQYYIDINKGVVRKFSNVGEFDAGNLTLWFNDEPGVDVDFHNICYKAISGNKMSRQTRIFEKDLVVTQPKLQAGNSWVGSLKVLVSGAGEYLIEKGSLGITTQNYTIVMASFGENLAGISYVIDKAPLLIKYTGTLNDVFDNVKKEIAYEVFGLKEDHTVEQLALIEEIDGDNVSATKLNHLGYRLVLMLNEDNSVASNYYIVNNTSPYYKIRRAVMEEIIFTPIQGGVDYNGRRHELKLEGITDTDITVLYDGEATIPTFVKPGTYMVRAEVSKPNHETQIVILTLTINRAVYTIGPDPVNRTLKYMDKLPTLTSTSDLGEYKLAEGQVLHPNKKTYDWVFTPYDDDFYQYYVGLPENGYLVRGKIALNVEKAKPTFDVRGPLEQTEGDPVALNARLVGLDNANVIVRYIGADGTIYESLPTEAGKYGVVVEYLGNEEYAGGVYESTLTINPKRDFTWVWIAIGVIAGLAILSSLFFLVRRPKRYDDSH